MENFYLVHEKITVTGPRGEINSLMVYLKNEEPNVHVVKSSPHFPSWKSVKDLYLVVYREKLEKTVRKIGCRLESGSIYRGWIDFSQVFYPICPVH